MYALCMPSGPRPDINYLRKTRPKRNVHLSLFPAVTMECFDHSEIRINQAL